MKTQSLASMDYQISKICKCIWIFFIIPVNKTNIKIANLVAIYAFLEAYFLTIKQKYQ
jgi:hypothetical protein